MVTPLGMIRWDPEPHPKAKCTCYMVATRAVEGYSTLVTYRNYMLLSALVLFVLGSLTSAENVAPKGSRQSHETLRHTKGPFVIITTHVSETLDITGCVDDAKYSAIELHNAKSIRRFGKYTDVFFYTIRWR